MVNAVGLFHVDERRRTTRIKVRFDPLLPVAAEAVLRGWSNGRFLECVFAATTAVDRRLWAECSTRRRLMHHSISNSGNPFTIFIVSMLTVMTRRKRSRG